MANLAVRPDSLSLGAACSGRRSPIQIQSVVSGIAGFDVHLTPEGARSGQAIREISRLVMAPVLLLEIHTGGLNQKRYGSAATQLMSTPTFAPLAFGNIDRDARTRVEDPRIARLIYNPDDIPRQRQVPASEHPRAGYREPLGTLTLPVLGASLRWSVAYLGCGRRSLEQFRAYRFCCASCHCAHPCSFRCVAFDAAARVLNERCHLR